MTPQSVCFPFFYHFTMDALGVIPLIKFWFEMPFYTKSPVTCMGERQLVSMNAVFCQIVYQKKKNIRWLSLVYFGFSIYYNHTICCLSGPVNFCDFFFSSAKVM